MDNRSIGFKEQVVRSPFGLACQEKSLSQRAAAKGAVASRSGHQMLRGI
jgi:hypothetical protein